MIYRHLVKPLLFRCDPEWVHERTIAWAAAAPRVPGLLRLMHARYRRDHPALRTSVAGIEFGTPLGLAAGFDKSAQAVRALAALGFGHLEVGSISADPSPGNPRPRLWRLPADQAVCVHYGLPNEGAATVEQRLLASPSPVPLGINLVSTHRGPEAPCATPDEILEDYARSARRLQGVADYFMLNLSCPNTAEGRNFFETGGHLGQLLHRLGELAIDVPLFLKISPHHDDASLDRLLETIAPFSSVRGLMFNLSPTERRELRSPPSVWKPLPGAISGQPTRGWMDRRVAWLYDRIDATRYHVIAAGGVASAEDAYRKIRCGASLVQLYTALIYHGPGLVSQINRGLAALLRRDGFERVADAVGKGVSRSAAVSLAAPQSPASVKA